MCCSWWLSCHHHACSNNACDCSYRCCILHMCVCIWSCSSGPYIDSFLHMVAGIVVPVVHVFVSSVSTWFVSVFLVGVGGAAVVGAGIFAIVDVGSVTSIFAGIRVVIVAIVWMLLLQNNFGIQSAGWRWRSILRVVCYLQYPQYIMLIFFIWCPSSRQAGSYCSFDCRTNLFYSVLTDTRVVMLCKTLTLIARMIETKQLSWG